MGHFTEICPHLYVLTGERGGMDPELEERLREAGDELIEDHDEAVIADVIGEVEQLDDPTSKTTADLLRVMTGADQ